MQGNYADSFGRYPFFYRGRINSVDGGPPT